jgi:DNA-directed RNA polymerase subunit N (RpoN/RPB10)
MKLYQVKCLTCGSPISVDLNSKIQTCESCKNTFITSDDYKIVYDRIEIQSSRLYEIHKNLNLIWSSFSNVIENNEDIHTQVNGLNQIIELRKLIFEIE